MNEKYYKSELVELKENEKVWVCEFCCKKIFFEENFYLFIFDKIEHH